MRVYGVQYWACYSAISKLGNDQMANGFVAFIISSLIVLAFPSIALAEDWPQFRDRIDGRTFPSVFQAWNMADNLKGEDPLVTIARHDLLFHGAEFFDLRWDHKHRGLATGFTADSVRTGLQKRESLLKLNPNLILLVEI